MCDYCILISDVVYSTLWLLSMNLNIILVYMDKFGNCYYWYELSIWFCVWFLQVDFNWSSFNRGDVFIIDIGKLIFVWNGAEANRQERIKVCGMTPSLTPGLFT